LKRLERARKFIHQRRSLLLASIDSSGNPLASYAPFYCDDVHIYLFLSRLADHTDNLQQQLKASVLFIADEAESEEIFARTRVQYHCTVEVIDKNASTETMILDQLVEKYGETFSMIRNLPDFILFRLTSGTGNFVEGFALASTLPPIKELRTVCE
jgi:putative heme iron utilization protein